MISREHFARSLLLMFCVGGFVASLVIVWVSLAIGWPRAHDAVAIVGLAFVIGTLVSAWRLMANSERERVIECNGRNHPWITAEYLNGLLDECVKEQK